MPVDRRTSIAIAAVIVVLVGFALWRHRERPPVPSRDEPQELVAKDLVAAVERCLVGGTGVSGADAAMRLRRRRSSTSCASIARGAAASRDVRGVYPELASLAGAIAKELDEVPDAEKARRVVPSLPRFLDAALQLNLPPTSDARDVHPLLDEGLGALARRLEGARPLEAAPRPFVAMLEPWRVLPVPSGTRRALATLVRGEPATIPPFSLYESGRNIYFTDYGKGTSTEVFPGHEVRSFDAKALVLTDTELLAYDAPRSSGYAPSKTLLKAVSGEAFFGESCVNERGAVVAVVDKDSVQLVRVDGARAKLGPTLPRATAPGLTCTGTSILVAWVDTNQLHVATCTEECSVVKRELPALDAAEPTAHALASGEVVLVWSDGAAYRFQVAGAPARDLFELGDDDRAFSPGSKPRFLAYDDAVLASFVSGRNTLLVRFDREGATSLAP